MNKKIRNHPIMILDYSMKYFLIIISMGIASLVGGDSSELLFLIFLLIVALIIYLPFLLVFYIIYRKSYYEVLEDRIYIERKTLFGYKRKEIYFENIATVKVVNKFVYIPFKAAELQFNTGSSATKSKDDVRIYASNEQLLLIEKEYENFKYKDEIDVNLNSDELVEESENKANSKKDFSFIKKYTNEQSLKHVVITELPAFITIMIVVVPFIVFELVASKQSIFTSFIIILPILGSVFAVIKKVLFLSNFEMWKSPEGFSITRGLLAKTKSSVDFVDIKMITKLRNRLIDMSYLKIKAVGLTESESTKDIDGVYSLLDDNQFTDGLIEVIDIDVEPMYSIDIKYSYIIINSIGQHFVWLIPMCVIGIFSNWIFAALFLLVSQTLLLLINVGYYYYYKHFVKYQYNDDNIIITRGLLSERTIILSKLNLQQIEIRTNIVSKYFGSSKLVLFNFASDSDSHKLELNYVDYKHLLQVLEELKAK